MCLQCTDSSEIAQEATSGQRASKSGLCADQYLALSQVSRTCLVSSEVRLYQCEQVAGA